jgi:phosphomevalonate kinase
MSRVGASAPGKALVCGEYAVLRGAPAVVAAVDRRVSVQWSDASAPMPPEMAATLELATRAMGAVPGSLVLDATALRRDRVKLGLGSSAAAAAATAAAVFASHGADLDDPAVLRRVFDCAFEGHAAVAPQGSGVDVAASTFGGFLRFVRSDQGIDVRPLNPPSGLTIRLVWTGHAARTSDLVAKVHALRARDEAEYARSFARLAAEAESFVDAFERGTAEEVVQAGGSYAEAMAALGDASGAPIVESQLRLAAEIADRWSGSAKPCGAGGGDVAIAFFAAEENAHGFDLACAAKGLHPIEVSWGGAGVLALPKDGTAR